MNNSFLKDLEPLSKRLLHLERLLFDLCKKEENLNELEKHMLSPDFWNDKENAQDVVKKNLKLVKEIVMPFRGTRIYNGRPHCSC